MRQILRQASWLFSATIITRVTSFFYMIFLAKSLGVSGFGVLTVAVSYFGILTAISDFGFNRFVTREIARGELHTSDLLWNVSVIRLTLTTVVFALFSLGLYVLDTDKMRVTISLLASLAILPQSIALTFDGIFVGLKKLQYSSVALVIANLSATFMGIFLVNSGFGAIGAVNAIVIGQILWAVILTIFLFQVIKISYRKVTYQFIKQAVIGSLPYGILGVLGLLYFKIDSVLLSYLRGSYETGLYGAGYRFLEAVIFIPGAFASAIFPLLTQLHDQNISQLKKVYYDSLKLMILLGSLIALAFIFILPIIFRLFLPDYLVSVGVVRILAFSVPLIFAATPGVQVMLSTDKYLKQIIGFSIFTVLFNIILNLIFIPKFGFLAAAWITVASDVLSFAIFFQLTKKVLLKK